MSCDSEICVRSRLMDSETFTALMIGDLHIVSIEVIKMINDRTWLKVMMLQDYWKVTMLTNKISQ